MTKISTSLIGCLLALCMAAFGQTSPQVRFVAGGTTANSLAITKMAEKGSIVVSFLNGSMNDARALGLQLVNTSGNRVSFSLKVRTKDGTLVLSSENTSLEGGTMRSAIDDSLLGFLIAKDQKAEDFTVEITLN